MEYNHHMNKLFLTISLVFLSSCVSLESIGVKGDVDKNNAHFIEINDRNFSLFTKDYFSDTFNFSQENEQNNIRIFEIGDIVNIHIWESGPTGLFRTDSKNYSSKDNSSSSIAKTTLPPQTIDNKGNIYIPYVGRIKASDLNISELENKIYQSISLKANNPQVYVDGVFLSRAVTILGDIAKPQSYEIKGHEKIIDIISLIGIKNDFSGYLVTLSRNSTSQSISLNSLYSNPINNIKLNPEDIVRFDYNPLKVTVLGASNSNKLVKFGPDNSSLLNILGEVFGINNYRGDIRRVYIFRKTTPGIDYREALKSNSRLNVSIFDDGSAGLGFVEKDYALLSIDLSSKNSLIYSSDLKIYDDDIIIISNNSIYESQRILSIIGSIFTPVAGVLNAQNLSN